MTCLRKKKCTSEKVFENSSECFMCMKGELLLSPRSLMRYLTQGNSLLYFLAISANLLFYHSYLLDTNCFTVEPFVLIFIVFPKCFCLYTPMRVHLHADTFICAVVSSLYGKEIFKCTYLIVQTEAQDQSPLLFCLFTIFVCLFGFSSMPAVSTLSELCQKNICVSFLFWRKR